MIEELPDREGASGHLFGIGVCCRTPGGQDRFPPCHQEIAQNGQLLAMGGENQ